MMSLLQNSQAHPRQKLGVGELHEILIKFLTQPDFTKYSQRFSNKYDVLIPA
jgi:hypothetical protein